jgi:hypothetical protein
LLGFSAKVAREDIFKLTFGNESLHEFSKSNGVRLINISKYNKVCLCKHLSDNVPIKNYLKQGDALSPQLFNFASKYAVRKVEDNHMGLELNGTHQLLADFMNLLGYKIDTAEKNIETLIDARREVGLEINIEKTKYMLLSYLHNAGQNRDKR